MSASCGIPRQPIVARMTTRPGHPVGVQSNLNRRRTKQPSFYGPGHSVSITSIDFLSAPLRWAHARAPLPEKVPEPCRNLQNASPTAHCIDAAETRPCRARMPKKDAKLAETVTGSVTESITIVPGSHVGPRESLLLPHHTNRPTKSARPARLVAAPCPGPGPTSRRRRPWCLRPERGDGRSMAAWRRMGTRVRWSGSASSLRTLLSPGVCSASQPRYVASRAMCTAVLCA